jgi:hypothetical protein
LNFGRSDRSWSSPQANRDKRDNRLLRDCLTTKFEARRFGSKEKSESSGIRTESSQLELLMLMELMFPVTWLRRLALRSSVGDKEQFMNNIIWLVGLVVIVLLVLGYFGVGFR